MMNSASLSNLIFEFKNSLSESSWSKLRELLEPYIYFFPKRVYKAPQIFCGDFYLYIQPKLKSIILSYPIDSKYTFKTWLNQVLINQYADFSKQRIPEMSHDRLHENIYVAPPSSCSDNATNYMKNNNLDHQEATFWKFIHLAHEITPKEMIVLKEFTGQQMDHILTFYYKMLILQKIRYNKEQHINMNLDMIEQKILIYRERIKNLPNPDPWIMKKERLKNRKARLIRTILLIEKKSHQLATALFDDAKKGFRILSRIKQKLRNN